MRTLGYIFAVLFVSILGSQVVAFTTEDLNLAILVSLFWGAICGLTGIALYIEREL